MAVLVFELEGEFVSEFFNGLPAKIQDDKHRSDLFIYSVIQTGRPRADPVAVSEPLQGRCCFQHRAHTALRKRLYPRHPCHIADLKLSVMISTEGLAIPRSPLASGIPAHELPLALSPLRDPPQIRKEQSRFWK